MGLQVEISGDVEALVRVRRGSFSSEKRSFESASCLTSDSVRPNPWVYNFRLALH